jgi:hypothetical protein
MEISKRKLESYKRAEMVARECRYQLADNRKRDASAMADMVIYWMRSTGNIKYERPKQPRILPDLTK